jgi:hypothetical protein
VTPTSGAQNQSASSARPAVSHHYVPQWYQRRFIDRNSREEKLFYLDLHPERVVRPDGRTHERTALRRLGPVSCFQADYLYTLALPNADPDVLEKRFFGAIDSRGAAAVAFFSDYALRSGAPKAAEDLLQFIDAQKSRTPKGLAWLAKVFNASKHEHSLYLMQRIYRSHCTIWSECVWEILQCERSETKFIVTDHPVTTYNKALFPGARECRDPFDADISLLGTHTVFPLGLTRCLVMTNLGYVRDPNANPERKRENPRYFKPAILNLLEIQTGREISEQYVLAINYVLKSRARRYIAAGRRDWLYPEAKLRSTRWNKLGDLAKHFLHPDPRKVSFSTDVLMEYKDGSAWGTDEYGRLPIEDAEVKRLRDHEWRTFHRAQQSWDTIYGELSREEKRRALFGPAYEPEADQAGGNDPERE